MEIFSDEKREFMRQYTALGEKVGIFLKTEGVGFSTFFTVNVTHKSIGSSSSVGPCAYLYFPNKGYKDS